MTGPGPRPIDMHKPSSTDELRELLAETREPGRVALTPVEGGEPMPADEYPPDAEDGGGRSHASL